MINHLVYYHRFTLCYLLLVDYLLVIALSNNLTYLLYINTI